MLSISPPITSAAGVRYYLDLANEDYMTRGGEPLGFWFGEGALSLGLSGRVEREHFKRLMEGVTPDGNRPLTQNAASAGRQMGWDLTFSVPKSVSVLWSQLDPAARQQIEEAQIAAVVQTLEFLQRHALWTRRGHAGVAREQVGMCAAVFPHGTSRAGDPQLHCHAVLISACVRDDGTTGSILSRPLFVYKMAAGALYRATLGAELIARLGVTLVRNLSRPFEIAGVPASLMRAFSTRRQEVERFLAERNLKGAVAASRAALQSRSVKAHVAREVLLEQWRAVGQRLKWSTEQARALMGKGRSPVGPIPARDIVGAVRHLTEYHAHFTQRDLLRAIADQIQAKGYRIPQIEQAVARVLPRMVLLGQLFGEKHYTTRAILRVEQSFIQRVQEGAHSTRHVVRERLVVRGLAGRNLSEEQQQAVRHVTRAPGNVAVVSGLAGTGKSTMLSAAREIWEKSGFTVLGASLTGKAAESLQHSAGIQSSTLASLLGQLNRPLVSAGSVALSATSSALAPKSPRWSPFHGVRLPHLTFGIGSADGKRIGPRTIVVIDEAGLVGTRQMADLVDRLTIARAKVVLVGDRRQNAPIEAGAPFLSLTQRLSQANLQEIQRQREPWAREMVKDLAKGEVRKAIRELDSRGRIHVLGNREEAVSRLLDDWRRAGHPKDNLILASTREEVRALNQAAQEKRARCGELNGHPVAHRDQKFHVGDRVVFDANSSRLGVTNGTFGQVIRAAGDDLIVRLDSGPRVTVPLDRYPNISLGYALTGHRAQGLTCANSFSFVSNDFSGREMAYVQASRARDEAHFYLDQATAGRQLAGLEDLLRPARLKVMASDLLEGRHQENSQTGKESGRLPPAPNLDSLHVPGTALKADPPPKDARPRPDEVSQKHTPEQDQRRPETEPRPGPGPGPGPEARPKAEDRSRESTPSQDRSPEKATPALEPARDEPRPASIVVPPPPEPEPQKKEDQEVRGPTGDTKRTDPEPQRTELDTRPQNPRRSEPEPARRAGDPVAEPKPAEKAEKAPPVREEPEAGPRMAPITESRVHESELRNKEDQETRRKTEERQHAESLRQKAEHNLQEPDRRRQNPEPDHRSDVPTRQTVSRPDEDRDRTRPSPEPQRDRPESAPKTEDLQKEAERKRIEDQEKRQKEEEKKREEAAKQNAAERRLEEERRRQAEQREREDRERRRRENERGR